MDLASRIESYLLAHPRWVPIREIEEVFHINERILRASGRQQPLLHYCAISSAKPGSNGLKHYNHTTVKERLAYKHRRTRILIAEVLALKAHGLAISNAMDRTPPITTDLNGQTILPL